MPRETNLGAFVLHVRTAENIIHVFFGHGLQKVADLLLPLEGTHPGGYDRVVCNTDDGASELNEADQSHAVRQASSYLGPLVLAAVSFSLSCLW